MGSPPNAAGINTYGGRTWSRFIIMAVLLVSTLIKVDAAYEYEWTHGLSIEHDGLTRYRCPHNSAIRARAASGLGKVCVSRLSHHEGS